MGMTQIGGPIHHGHAAALPAPVHAPLPQAPAAPTTQATQQRPAAAAQSSVREFELDGVRGFWAESDGPMTAGLIFGVGMSDEAFHQRGLTHLIEHMSLHDIDRSITYNGSVDLTNTTLHCRGTLADAQGFFQAALNGLNNLPYHELERESRVLAAESARRPGSLGVEALAILYGYEGPGAVALEENGLLEVTPEKVEAWRQRYFVKENAAVFFHGPRPEGISLASLASGQRAVHAPPKRVLEAKPFVHQTRCAGPTMFSPFDRGGVTSLMASVAEERLTQRLRGEMGVSYDVSASMNELDSNTQLIAIGADAATGEDNAKTFEVMRVELERLASKGPTSEEVRFYVSRLDKAHSGELGDITMALASSKARSFVEGRHYVEYPQFRANLAAMTMADFTEPIRKALEAPLWTVPHGTAVTDVRLTALPMWSESITEGQTFTSKYHETELRISDASISLCAGEGAALTVELANVIGVSSYTDGGVALHDAEGFVLRAVPSDYSAEAAVAKFVAAVPTDRVVKIDERLRPEEAQAELVPKKEPGWRDKLKNKRKKKSQERQYAEATAERPLAVPEVGTSRGHIGSIQFAEAIVAEDWALAERLFDAAPSPQDQMHFIAVGARTGGRPDRLDQWVDGSVRPGLALLLRGQMGVIWGWDARSSARSEYVSREMYEEFWSRLRVAEADLLSAAKELPDSPLPWVPLLDTARGLQIPREEADERYVNHVQRGGLLVGHLRYQQYVCEKWFGSHDDMWEHAEFIASTADDGSTELAVVSMALIEHWLDVKNQDGCLYETGDQFLAALGKTELVREAQRRSHTHKNFPVPTADGARALEIFFTSYVAASDWRSAAALITPIGNRASGHPIDYFTDVPWETLCQQVLERVQQPG